MNRPSLPVGREPVTSCARRALVGSLVVAALAGGVLAGCGTPRSVPGATIPTSQVTAPPPGPLTHQPPHLRARLQVDARGAINGGVAVRVTIENLGSSVLREPTLVLSQDGQALTTNAPDGCTPRRSGLGCQDVAPGATLMLTLMPRAALQTAMPIQIAVGGNGVDPVAAGSCAVDAPECLLG